MSDLVLIATIGGQRVAIDAASVESIVDLWQIVPVPLAAGHVIGLAAVRSRVLTVIDAASAVGLSATETGNRAIVISSGGHRYGLRVDSIAEVVAPIGPEMPFEASICGHWAGVATGTVDTPQGFAVKVDPAMLIAGPVAKAA